jgi:UDP-N-acetylmuramoyl-L-alanyl-D-glutamate--2,6-diaminopimelate ligase
LQGRVHHLYPKVAGITNTSPEHLDYHGTMERYRAAKALLFRMLRGRGTKVLNRNDETYELYRSIPSARTISYGAESEGESLWLTNEAMHTSSSTATLHGGGKDKTWPLRLVIPGKFNLDNALCAIGCAMASGIEINTAVKALESFRGVPGRIERIDEGQNFSAFVDFTVTPKSYESTLSTLRSMLPSGKRLIVVTGSCGDRMKEKRPTVGAICARLADIVIVTNEDPYTEDPEKIIDDVISGIPKDIPIFTEPSDITKSLNKYCIRFSDRMEAIRYALQAASSGVIILFAGKGADITMMTKTGQIPWNEREIVREKLKRLRR